MQKLLLILTAGVSFALTACDGQPEGANMSTTVDSPAATIDNNPGIGAGATIASNAVPAGTTVKTIAGTSLTMSANASITATGTATFTNTVAYTVANNPQYYAQYVATTVQQNFPKFVADAGNAAGFAADLATVLQQSGLVPVNATQRTTATNIVSIGSKVQGGAAALISLMSGIQTTGVVPTVATSSTSSTMRNFRVTPVALRVNDLHGWNTGDVATVQK